MKCRSCGIVTKYRLLDTIFLCNDCHQKISADGRAKIVNILTKKLADQSIDSQLADLKSRSSNVAGVALDNYLDQIIRWEPPHQFQEK